MSFYILRLNVIHSVGGGGPSSGMRYSLGEACKKCGAGAESLGPCLVSSIKKTAGRILRTDANTFLIDLDIAKQFQSKGINSLAEVFDKNMKQLPYMELRAEATLPPFSKECSGYENGELQCSKCKRSGHFDAAEGLKLIYKNINPNLLKKNVLATYECFGYGHIREPFEKSGFAVPYLVVSELVANIFKSEKIRSVSFDERVEILKS